MRTIPSNTATAALRRIFFTLVDATDRVTPEDIAVTGVKPTLSFDGATPVTATNDIVKVNGAAGEYYAELTQAESNQAAGTQVRGWLTPSGCALAKLEAQIGSGGLFSGTVDATLSTTERNALADALLDRDMATGTDSGSTTVRTVRQALRALRNRWAVAGGTLTVMKEDDTTPSHTAAVTGTTAVTEVNPAGGA